MKQSLSMAEYEELSAYALCKLDQWMERNGGIPFFPMHMGHLLLLLSELVSTGTFSLSQGRVWTLQIQEAAGISTYQSTEPLLALWHAIKDRLEDL